MDVSVAGLALVLLAPLMVGIAVLIRIDSPGGAIFRQVRSGRNGVPFTINKYRTMTLAASTATPERIYKGDARITRLGAILRRTSLDELPQLINVVRGDMSLVGPRPDLPDHVAGYTPFQRRRLEVRPGITGWSQVNGRNELTWDERIELDVAYIDDWSLRRDIEVGLKTVKVVLSGRGAQLT
jgi:lipopolysaccharide/colanic/teichoic acid biosynthesis glycosyltransferase